MAILTNSLLSTTTQTLFRFRKAIIVLVTIGLGILLGYYHSLSFDTAALTVSMIVILIHAIIIAHKPLDGLLILLLFTPFLEQYVEIDMGAGIPDLSFSRFAIGFLLVFMLLKASIREFQFKPVGLTEFFMVLTVIGIATSAPLADEPPKILQQVISWHFAPLIMFFLAKNLVRDREDLRKIFWAIALFSLAAAIYAIYEHSTGHILFVGKLKSVEELRTRYTDSLYLIRGLLGRSGNFGRVFIISIPLMFYLFFENNRAKQKIFLAVALVIEFYAMLITYNRTSWYALMIGLFVLQFFYPQFRKLFLAMVVVAAVVLWITWDQVNESAVVEERLNSENSTLDVRQARWNAAWNMWQEKPIRGWGFDRFFKESGRFRTDGSTRNLISIENDYLDIMVGSGLVGFVPYLLFLVMPLIHSVFLFFKARASNWAGFIKPETIALYWTIIVAFAIGSYTQVQNEATVKILPFVVMGAIIGTHQHYLRRSEVTENSTDKLSSFTPVTTEPGPVVGVH